MAAGQQKKRLISSCLHEHCRGKKKKKIDSSDYLLNLRSQIYLEWNDSQNKAVAKREQIGLTWADMAPFVDSGPPHRSGLADVLCVPRGTYSLNNLMEVLSYEVWATSLSESERKLLTQFLPSGTGAEQAVQSLLSGENHHFGNHLVRWSTLLCSGNLHPDGVLQRERRIRSNKKQYYLELNKYHTVMLEDLKKWKDKWIRCDNHEQLWRKALINPKERTLLISSGKAKEIPQKICIRNNDTAKYMSYIKINKNQLEAIKSLKHSGDGIQSTTLSCVLGDINSFHIHPYEALENEKSTRLHEHWLQIVSRDIPMAFEAMKEKRSHREQLKKHLEQELSEKRTLISHKLKGTPPNYRKLHITFQLSADEILVNVEPWIDMTFHYVQRFFGIDIQIEAKNPEISREEKIKDAESEHDPVDNLVQQDVVSASISSDNGNQLERVPSLNSHPEMSPKELEEVAVGQDVLIFGDNHTVLSQFRGKDLVEAVKSHTSSSPVGGIWQAVDATRYNSSSDSSLRKPEPIEESQVSPMFGLEREIECEGRESDDASLFSLYASQRRDELLPSFTKGTQMLPYHSSEQLNESKQPELQFLMANGGLSETLQFPNQIQVRQSLIEQNHARERDHLYMRQMMNKSAYSNGRCPSQDLYSSSNGDLVERNWFPGDRQDHSSYWSRIEPSSSGAHRLGDGGTSDGSLLSVLSASTHRPSRSQQNPTDDEQSTEARGFVHSNDGVYGYASHQFKNSSNHEAAAAANTAALQVQWMNYQPHQQDPFGKPFVRSWNQ